MKNLFNFMLLGLMILASCSSEQTEEVAPLGKGPQTIQVTLPMGGTKTKSNDTIVADQVRPKVNNITIYVATAQGVILKTLNATLNNTDHTWSSPDIKYNSDGNHTATIANVAGTATQVYVVANAPYVNTNTTLNQVKTNVSIYSQQADHNLLMTGESTGFQQLPAADGAKWTTSVTITPLVARFQITGIKIAKDDALTEFHIKHIYISNYYPEYSLTSKSVNSLILFSRWDINGAITNPSLTTPSIDLSDDLSTLANVTTATANVLANDKCYAYHFFPETAVLKTTEPYVIDNKQPYIILEVDGIKLNNGEAINESRYLVIKNYKKDATHQLTQFAAANIYNLNIEVAAKYLNTNPNAPKVTVECTVTVQPWTAQTIIPGYE